MRTSSQTTFWAFFVTIVICFGVSGFAGAVPPLPPDERPVPMRPDARFHRVIVNADTHGASVPAVAASGSVPCHQNPDAVYCNTLGTVVYGRSVTGHYADDIVLAGVAGCPLDRFVIRVTGDRLQDGAGAALGAYTVRYGLYPTCLSAVAMPVPIAGTSGEVAVPAERAGDITEIVHIPAEDVSIPNQLYLGLTFSRIECGTIAGAPAEKGYSADLVDAVQNPCGLSLGGYPLYPHGSFYLEIYVRGDCAGSFLGYRNSNQFGEPFSVGTNGYFADDITLHRWGCNLVAYEVAFEDAVVAVDLRTRLDNNNPASGGVIPGTSGICFPRHEEVQICRVEVDPPVPLPPNFWIAFRSGSSRFGPIKTCRSALVGYTWWEFKKFDPAARQWVWVPAVWPCWGAFDVTLYCEGSPPAGACCDTLLTQGNRCVGGLDAGAPCRFHINCRSGTCVGDAICRDLPELNCPTEEWIEGPTCREEPFGSSCAAIPTCESDADCDDGLFCNGIESCVDGDCVDGERVCDDAGGAGCENSGATQSCAENDESAVCAWCRNVVIDGCDAGVPDRRLDDRTTMNDAIAHCRAQARNHGQFVSCVNAAAREWRHGGLISGREMSRIVRCAAHSHSADARHAQPLPPAPPVTSAPPAADKRDSN